MKPEDDLELLGAAVVWVLAGAAVAIMLIVWWMI